MIGQKISHYKILKKLGEGGMGEVYLAEDTKLDRQVALKFLPSRIKTGDNDKKRFIQEAKAAAALNHPNVCIIHDITEHEGQQFIVMEYVKGQTLKETITSDPLTLTKIIDYALQIADALQAAHSKGIIHRDIKSENIMVTDTNQIKVMDFGLAKLKGSVKLTKTSSTAGTVGYMSPESIHGKDVDVRSDIFSFGIVLYEMLTGQLPFKGEYEAAMIYSILNEEPEPVQKYRPDLSSELLHILNRAMEKNRDERYENLDEFKVDLELASKELEVNRENQPSTTEKQKRSQRIFLYAGIPGLIFLIILALLIFFYLKPDKVDRKSIAVLPFENMNKDERSEYFSDGITEDIITQLSKIQDLRVISSTSSMRYKKTDKTLKEIGEKLGVATILEGSVRQEGDDVRITAQLIDTNSDEHIWAETYDRKMTGIFAIQSDVAKQIALALRAKLTPAEKLLIEKKPTENLKAYNLYLKGHYFWNKRTEAGLKKAIQYFEEAINLDPHFALGYAGVADSYNLLPTYSSLHWKDAYPKAKEAALKALSIDDSLAEAHTSLGMVKMEFDRDFEGAEREFKRSINLNPNLTTNRHWYAIYLMRRGRFDESIKEIKRAYSLDPLSLVINRAMGRIYYMARQYDKSIEALQRTIELDPAFNFAHFFLGKVYLQKFMYDKALEEFYREKDLSSPIEPVTEIYIGITFVKMGQQDKAQEVLLKAIETSKQTKRWDMAVPLLYFALGEKDQCFGWLERTRDRNYKESFGQLFRFRYDPAFDDIRSDPRFTALLKKVGLEK